MWFASVTLQLPSRRNPRMRLLRRLRIRHLRSLPRHPPPTTRRLNTCVLSALNALLRRLLPGSVPFQILQRHPVLQRALVRRAKGHLRYIFLFQLPVACGFHRLLPARGAQAPFHAGLDAHVAEVVALGRGEVEEGVVDGRGDDVVAFVVGAGAAVAVAEEAGGRVRGVLC